MATSKEKTAVATGPTVDQTAEEVTPYIPGTDWDTMVATADQVDGHDLAKDELLDALVGVPFALTALTFRKGIIKNGEQAAYVSCEGVIAPEHVLKRRRVNMEALPFEPGSQIIFNDGSTGIYRQIVAYLTARGVITLPVDLPEEGPYGETRYDLPPGKWAAIHAGDITFQDDGWADFAVHVRLTCPRGLRLSEYTNDHNPSGSTTRYLA